VYNFAIGGATLKQELALLKHFRDTYAIDQVLFYTGGNDVIRMYYDRVPSANAWTGFISLELVKAANRLATRLRPGGPTIDAAERPGVRRSNRLAAAMTEAAAYCAEQRLQCDVVLQPWLLGRAHPVGSETRLKPAVEANYPGLADLWDAIYAGALDAGAKDHAFDLRAGLDDVGAPIFADMIHVNEIGNAGIALRLVPIVARGLRHHAETPGEQTR
jgi:hypothetical protein